jgi:hypothetical protein
MICPVPCAQNISFVAIPGETFETLLTMEIARYLWRDKMFPIGGGKRE